MRFTGSCHCGDVAFEVQGDIGQVLACNCSICRRKGSLLWFVPRDNFELKTPDENASTYLFNKHAIRHRFCARCGMHPYAEGVDPQTSQPIAAINVRCLDDVDLDGLKVLRFDGASL